MLAVRPLLLSILLLLFSVVNSAPAKTTSPTFEPTFRMDTEQYSYICLKENQNLCLGISPGDGEPYYDEFSVFKLQVKQRLANEFSGTDYKKTRWDVDYGRKTISLSNFQDLCMASTYDSDFIGLYPCGQVVNGIFKGIYQLAFNQNILEMAEIRSEADPTMCMTVMTCNGNRKDYCDWFSNTVQTGSGSSFTSGSILRMKKCWFASGGNNNHKTAQTFVQALDCAPGCSPMLQNNNVCDLACANDACELDNGYCRTLAPSMPTSRPTQSPTTSKPTSAPVTKQPTLLPTGKPSVKPTALPTKSPAIQATEKPTSQPTKLPTGKPTLKPSKSPVGTPTQSPTVSTPTMSPTYSQPTMAPTMTEPTASPTFTAPSPMPTESPTIDPEIALIRERAEQEQLMLTIIIAVSVPVLLILLCCLIYMCVARDRRRRFEKKPKQWGSMIDVNQAAYTEYFKEHGQNKSTAWCSCCCFRTKKSRSNSSNSALCCLAPLAPSKSSKTNPSAFSSHYAENQRVAAYNPPMKFNPPQPAQQQGKPIATASVEQTHGRNNTSRPKTTTQLASYGNEGYLI